MKPNKTISLFLTRDNFLDALLDEGERWSPDAVRSRLPSVDARDALFEGIAAYVLEKGYAAPADHLSPETGQPSLMLGKSLHVNVSSLALRETRGFAAAFAVLLSLAAEHYTNNPLALAALVPIITSLVTKLKKPLGEVCVIECLQEERARRPYAQPTAAVIGHELMGEQCRYPGDGCRYENERICTMNHMSVRVVLQALEKRGVVQPVTHEEPREWLVRF